MTGGTMTKNNIKGFTVLEIMIVVLLIGIIGIAAVPSVGLIRKQEVQKIAKELCLDLSAQRMQAMTAMTTSVSRKGLQLIGDETAGQYYSYQLTPALATASGGTRATNKDNSTNIQISMKATGESGVIESPEKVQFDNYGYLIDTADKKINKLTITITYDTAESKITFNGVTGNYKID
jgi:Tfp pilus assembly protein FimT